MKASDGSRRHRHDESVLSSATAQQGPSPSQQQRPWYASGGMHVNVVGILLAINAAPFLVLLCNDRLSPVHRHVFLAVWLSLCAASAVSSHTVHCVVIVPTGLASLWLVVVLDHPLRLLAVSLALGITKINICMSVCLHRYAAHAAFKCGPCTSFALCVVGCLANQGGPLWWASKHRCHHKFCDMPRDPHSPQLMGVENAFVFFQNEDTHGVDEEFVPRHLLPPPSLESSMSSQWMNLRVLDTWAWTVVALELAVAFSVWGREGLFCAYTSGWICQFITLWFNVANHPPDGETATVCRATDGVAPFRFREFFLPFYLFDAVIPFFAIFVMEGEHEHHHLHSTLAKRSPSDIAYWTFIKPLEMMGLVWDVVVK